MSAAGVAPPIAPVNTGLPVISGITEVGQTLTTTNGTWSNTPTGYTYQWKRGGVNIGGATSGTYLLVTADLTATITVAVTATNSAGSATASSTGVGPITSAGVSPPPGVTGLIGWWDASVTASLSLTGSDINSVADQSGGGNNLTWDFGHPTYSATGLAGSKPSINIASAQSLRKNSFPMGTGNTLTFFFVSTLGSSSSHNSGRYLSYASTSNAFDYDDAQSWMIYRASSSTTTQLTFYRNGTTTTGTTTASPAVHRFIGTVNASGVMTLYIDNVAATTATLGGNWSSLGTFIIGSKLANRIHSRVVRRNRHRHRLQRRHRGWHA